MQRLALCAVAGLVLVGTPVPARASGRSQAEKVSKHFKITMTGRRTIRFRTAEHARRYHRRKRAGYMVHLNRLAPKIRRVLKQFQRRHKRVFSLGLFQAKHIIASEGANGKIALRSPVLGPKLSRTRGPYNYQLELTVKGVRAACVLTITLRRLPTLRWRKRLSRALIKGGVAVQKWWVRPTP